MIGPMIFLISLIAVFIISSAQEKIPSQWQNSLYIWIGPKEDAPNDPNQICEIENPIAVYITSTKVVDQCYAYGGQPGFLINYYFLN